MATEKFKHYFYVPFVGLGLYGGRRWNPWLKNRITIFNQFVVPSLLAQTNQNFSIWVSWRPQEKGEKQVENFKLLLISLFGRDRVIFTYNGVCFWDDKFPDDEAHEKLITNLHHTIGELMDDIGDVKNVLMTIQPSDDCYYKGMVDEVQRELKPRAVQAFSYLRGFMGNYQTLETIEYNPETHPPFYTIKFPKEIFIDPFKHAQYTGPYHSHEYAVDKLNGRTTESRGFLVGCHGENISTHFNNPYGGKPSSTDIIEGCQPLKIRYSIRKQIMRRLPHKVQRKLRYIFGEKLLSKII